MHLEELKIVIRLIVGVLVVSGTAYWGFGEEWGLLVIKFLLYQFAFNFALIMVCGAWQISMMLVDMLRERRGRQS